jgi:hypothetical protein
MPNTKKSRCILQRDFFVQGSEKGEQFNRTDSHIKIAEPPPVRYKNNRADAAPNLLGLRFGGVYFIRQSLKDAPDFAGDEDTIRRPRRSAA